MIQQPRSLNPDRWPSVSKVLGVIGSKSLLEMYGDLGTVKVLQVFKEAAGIGDETHLHIERFTKGETKLLDPDLAKHSKAKAALRSFRLFHNHYNPNYLEAEVTCRSKVHQYICRFDQLLSVDITKIWGLAGGIGLVMTDWKTSNSVDDKYVLQLAANAQAFYEERGIFPDIGMVVKLSKDHSGPPLCEVHIYKNLRRFVPVFLSLLRVWRFLNGWGGWGKASAGPKIDMLLDQGSH